MLKELYNGLTKNNPLSFTVATYLPKKFKTREWLGLMTNNPFSIKIAAAIQRKPRIMNNVSLFALANTTMLSITKHTAIDKAKNPDMGFTIFSIVINI
ncbi:hypothetical protein D6B99_13185 [Arachidicoccus soli]|uniref:Uncharacterized protein n=1 Tax=Arachidicoccus soli TaxID=2341117 RepID=A0A386HRQ2_9BACT|nr:hypothetical protein D6B99_13185 [Arachidicoccus soli]